MKKILLVAVTMFLLSACGGQTTTSKTATPAATTPITAEVTLKTSEAPASSQSPTPTPKPILSAQQFIDAFVASGISISEVIVFDEATDPNRLLGRPRGYIEKVSWYDDSVDNSFKYPDEEIELENYYGQDCTLEIFDNVKDAKSRLKYILEVQENYGSMFIEYTYYSNCYLLRLTNDITPSDAGKYEMVFNELVGASGSTLQ